jgi:Type VI secretion system/phage-baseplate injector OB domain
MNTTIDHKPSGTGRKAHGFYGKYRGVVTDNADLMALGRIRAKVPDVFQDNESSWALPCLPAGAMNHHGMFMVPPVGSLVWIEFEQGDSDCPIWTGGFWGSHEDVPQSVPRTSLFEQVLMQTETIVLQTQGHVTVALSDAVPSPIDGGIILRSGNSDDSAKIVINSGGIYLDNGKGAKITLVGPMVSINKDSLTIVG